MSTTQAAPASGHDALSSLARAALARAAAKKEERDPKLARQAQDFESLFLETTLGHLTSGLTGDGPLGDAGTGQETWRGMLTQEYARSIARHGGVGIADSVYRELVRMQAGQTAGGARAA